MYLKAAKIIKIVSLGIIGLLVVGGGYIGWQINQAKRMASEYAEMALQSASSNLPDSVKTSSPVQTDGEASSDSQNGSGNSNSAQQTSGEHTITPNNNAAAPNDSSAPTTESPGEPAGESGKTPSTSVAYKQLMTDTYSKTLNAMESVKLNTLALKDGKTYLSNYKAMIAKAKATFSTAQEFVQHNPPDDEKLQASYKEFLAGITLANQSMDVVMQGISSLSAASFYAAKEMGGKARDQVVHGYSGF